LWGNLRVRDHLKDVVVDWEDTIKMDLQKRGIGSMDCTGRAQDSEKWRVLMNAVKNFGVP
jgi:glucuronate isomerase